jgi:uncharacterized protein (UPF0332 family)
MKRRKIPFVSFGAIIMEDSPKGSDKGIVGFRLNCDFPNYTTLKNNTIKHVFEIIDRPLHEILKRRRIESVEEINRIHIIMHADQTKNEILVNDKVRFDANIELSNGDYSINKTISEGSNITVLGLYKNYQHGENEAHVMLYKFKSDWQIACDLFYDVTRAINKLKLAKQFLKASQLNLDNNLWGPFIESLFSATELATQSVLLLEHKPDFSTKQIHPNTKKLFEIYTMYGKIDTKYHIHIENLYNLRKKARYLNDEKNDIYVHDETDAKKLIITTEKFLEITGNIIKEVQLSKKYRPTGHYISMNNFNYLYFNNDNH